MAPFLHWLNLNPSSDVNCLCTVGWTVWGLCVDGQDKAVILCSIQVSEKKKKRTFSSVCTIGLKHERSSHSYDSSRAAIKLTFTAHISLIGISGCEKCGWTLNAAILVSCFSLRPSPILHPLTSLVFSLSVQPTVLFYNFVCVNKCSVSDLF